MDKKSFGSGSLRPSGTTPPLSKDATLSAAADQQYGKMPDLRSLLREILGHGPMILSHLIQKISDIDEKFKACQVERSERINKLVSKVVPALSGKVLRQLAVDYPSLLSTNVGIRRVFEKTTLAQYIFNPSSYQNSLLWVQTAASRFFGEDQNQKMLFPDLQDRLDQLLVSKDALQQQYVKVQGSLEQALVVQKQYADKNIQVPFAALQIIQQVAEKLRDVGGFQAETSDLRSSSTSVFSSNKPIVPRPIAQLRPASSTAKVGRIDGGDNDTDLWIDAFTGVPTSLRTLLINEVMGESSHQPDALNGGGGNFGGGGANGTWDSLSAAPPDPSSSLAPAEFSSFSPPLVGADALLQSDATQSFPGADDSLGTYS